MTTADNRITEQQLELLKSFRYLTGEKEISEVKELLSMYYEHKLDAAIDKVEAERNYTSEVYEAWLNKQ
jgi:hypothetical protein